MSAFTVPVTITGIESGLSETMDAVVDDSVLHSVIPADTLARLGIAPGGHSSVIDLPRGNARARLRRSDDDKESHKDDFGDDFCATISVLFGPAGGCPILGRTALSALLLEVDADHGRLIPAKLRIPGDAMADILTAGEQPAASGEPDGAV